MALATFFQLSALSILQLRLEVIPFKDGAFITRGKEPQDLVPNHIAHHYYEHHAKKATARN